VWKAVLAVTTAALIAGSSLVLARQPECDSGQRWQPSPEDMSAFTDARIAALKAGLKLTPDQEKNWPAFEAAFRDMSKARAERMAAREKEQPPTDPIERLRGRAEALATAAARLTKFADAQEPLYKSLDVAQKHRFEILSHALRSHHKMRFGGWEEHGRSNWCNRSEHGGSNTDL
jgi:zinc resistance-associated protein